TKNPFHALLMEAGLHASRSNYDKALSCLSRYSDLAKGYGMPLTHLERLIRPVILHAVNFLASRRRFSNIPDDMARAIHNYRYGNKENSAKLVGELADKYPEHEAEFSLLAALWYRSVGKAKESELFFERSVRVLLENRKGSFSRITESKNTVLEYASGEFIRDAYLVKMGPDESRLWREDFVVKLHRSAYAEKYLELLVDPDQIPTEETLSIFGSPTTLATRRLKKETLEQVLQRGNEAEIFSQSKMAITTLVRLMAASTPVYNKMVAERKIDDICYDYEAEFHRRVVSRLGKDHPFIDAYSREITEIERISDRLHGRVLAHRDATDVNLMTDGYVIDFESAGYADPILDPATATASLDGNLARRLFSHAHSEISQEIRPIPIDDSRHLFELVRVHNAMGQMAARVARGRPEDVEKAKKFYLNVREGLKKRNPQLAVMFDDYVAHSKYNLSA
ncbi:MAG: phosphotransferase, partial [Nanoarchaeota archaeon]